ncbi:NUDIX domain-containing protein [Yaniella halotolerans]|uniref:NUDIX domain-containing protein n=1 Tax=Yaniella halotolerans TaxID=225453 RepID=UPI0003B47D6C|nr:NUDIX domain-containing protein [Yaniella halotolerans]
MRPAKRIGKLTTARVTAATNDQGTNAKIVAAGTVPWRIKAGQLQVLLIHRPQYNDWSWPKGRLDPHETLPETAWRETKEEVGLRLTLGIPLGVIRYKTSNGNNRKEVWYWAARVIDQRPKPDANEVDETRWATVEEAKKLLTKKLDKKPLKVLAEAFEAHHLATIPFIVLRQAKAIPAESWTKDEVDRPLADSGYTQAKAVSKLLRSWAPARIVTSKYTRSLETIAPFVKKHGGAVRNKKWVNLRTVKAHPKFMAKRLRTEFKRHEPTLVCAQPSVTKRILKEIKSWVREDRYAVVNPKDVYTKKKANLSPGSILVVHRATHLSGKIVSVERYEPNVH